MGGILRESRTSVKQKGRPRSTIAFSSVRTYLYPAQSYIGCMHLRNRGCTIREHTTDSPSQPNHLFPLLAFRVRQYFSDISYPVRLLRDGKQKLGRFWF